MKYCLTVVTSSILDTSNEDNTSESGEIAEIQGDHKSSLIYSNLEMKMNLASKMS